MAELLLTPPVAFLLMLGAALLLTALLSRLSYRNGKPAADMEKSYACGEDVPTHLMQPDYSQFFPFAFFFTVLHVIALIITTVPIETLDSFAIAVIYILGGVTGLFIIFRR